MTTMESVQDSLILHIKNMVCRRCRMVVQQILTDLSIPYSTVELGEVHLLQPLNADLYTHLRERLSQVGFELIGDRRSHLIEQIRAAVLDYVHDRSLMEKWKLSAYLTDRLHMSYSLLSSAFSESRGMTIERFCILQKVERVKELLVYDELSMAEIAFRLNYSSAAHLSGQFKQITGMSPREFRKLGGEHRHALDEV